MPRIEKAKEITTVIGSNIRAARIMQGVSRAELARRLGISHQQVAKYETGANLISAAALTLISKILDEPVTFFYDSESIEYKQHRPLILKKLCSNLMKLENNDKYDQYETLNKLVLTLIKNKE